MFYFSKKDLTAAFKMFDRDGNGKVTAPELQKTFEKEYDVKLSEKEAQKKVKDFDKNKDGSLSYEEFMKQ